MLLLENKAIPFKNTQAKIRHVTLDFYTASFMQRKKKSSKSTRIYNLIFVCNFNSWARPYTIHDKNIKQAKDAIFTPKSHIIRIETTIGI